MLPASLQRIALLVTATALAFAAACDGSDPEPPAATPDAGPGPDTGGVVIPGTEKNHPPELAKIGDRIVAVGEALIIVVEASDPDDDKLNYSAHGVLPDGARFIKSERRFEWTPSAMADPVFVTFIVSDGVEFDRETVRIEVVTEKDQHPPVFLIVGDQTLAAGVRYDLQLEATDPDGDALSFGFAGPVPKAAEIAEASGLFSWTPVEGDVGQKHRVTFRVSDGQLSDQMDVNFSIIEAGGDGPAPPVFEPVKAQKAKVGELLSFVLVASDPNDDAVTFGIQDGAPPTATLTDATFAWTPAPADAGLAWAVTFSASDGALTSYLTVDISVAKPTSTTTCTDDAGEPNEDIEHATPIEPGTVTASICDTELVPIDKDLYRVEVPATMTLEATLTFDATAGDLDLFLADAGGGLLTSSETLAATEVVGWKSETTQSLLVLVTGVGQEKFALPYTLTVEVDVTAACADDAFEPNDDFATAKPLPASPKGLAICPGDVDVWSLPIACGAEVQVTLDTGGTADLDMGLFGSADPEAPPVAQAATEAPVESFTLPSAAKAGTYYLLVVGYPPSVASGTYDLTVATAGGCSEDALSGNGTSKTAHGLSGVEGEITDLAICCGADWFGLELAEGDELLAAVTPTSPGGSVGLALLGSDGTTELDAEEAAAAGATVSLVASVGGTFFLRVNGATGSVYTLEWLLEAGGPTPTGCTGLSCPKYDVCDFGSGDCVSDYCSTDGECPAGYICRETYCINPCTTDADCRGAYACKGFDAGPHCGIEGSGAPGSDCYSHTSCDGASVCTFKGYGGYCAQLGCQEHELSCPTGTSCVSGGEGGLSLCGLDCSSSAGCRTEDGFTCTGSDVCLPW